MLRRIIGDLPPYRTRIIDLLTMIRKIHDKRASARLLHILNNLGNDKIGIPQRIVIGIDIMLVSLGTVRRIGNLFR